MESAKGHICRSCRLRLSTPRPSRTFSTSSSLKVVPPESPYYVDIPNTYQAFAPYTPKPKGTLPTPRDPFPNKRPERRLPGYIASVTPDPLPQNIKKPSQLSTTGKHKLKMAERRKSQLREGLAGLQSRKQAELNAMSSRSQSKQRERAALLSQSEREDARLTNVSVPSTMQPKTRGSSSSQTPLSILESEVAHAKQLHASKLANYQSQTQAKHDAKMDALHTLYMNARSFVTNKDQLDALLADQFDNPKRFQSDVANGDSMWNLGAPVSIKDMVVQATKSDRKSMGREILSSVTSAVKLQLQVDAEQKMVEKDQARMKRIAEKLSGGKI